MQVIVRSSLFPLPLPCHTHTSSSPRSLLSPKVDASTWSARREWSCRRRPGTRPSCFHSANGPAGDHSRWRTAPEPCPPSSARAHRVAGGDISGRCCCASGLFWDFLIGLWSARVRLNKVRHFVLVTLSEDPLPSSLKSFPLRGRGPLSPFLVVEHGLGLRPSLSSTDLSSVLKGGDCGSFFSSFFFFQPSRLFGPVRASPASRDGVCYSSVRVLQRAKGG